MENTNGEMSFISKEFMKQIEQQKEVARYRLQREIDSIISNLYTIFTAEFNRKLIELKISNDSNEEFMFNSNLSNTTFVDKVVEHVFDEFAIHNESPYFSKETSNRVKKEISKKKKKRSNEQIVINNKIKRPKANNLKSDEESDSESMIICPEILDSDSQSIDSDNVYPQELIEDCLDDDYEESDGKPNNPGSSSKQYLTLQMKCTVDNCPLMVNTRAELNKHLYNAHKILPNQCMVKGCSKSFQQKLGQHINSEHKGLKKFSCSKCPKKFDRYRALYSHISRMHMKGEFKCAISNCNFIGQYRGEMEAHHRREHRGKVSKHFCQTCGVEFNKKSDLDIHEDLHRTQESITSSRHLRSSALSSG